MTSHTAKTGLVGTMLGIAAAASVATAPAKAADLTVNAGTTSAPYAASGLYQVIEAGNPYSDAPRTVVYDQSNTPLNVGGSSAPITTPDFSIDVLFTTTSQSLLTTSFGTLISGTDVTASLYDGNKLLASSQDGTLPTLNIAPGTYSLDLTGSVGSNKEAEGQFSFSGSPAVAPVSAAPEPATWGLMMAGVGLAGAMLRRRNAATANLING